MDIIKNTSYVPVAQGRTGQSVANTLNDELSYSYGCERYVITEADFSTNYVEHTHNKGTINVIAKLYDSTNVEQSIAGLFTVVNTNTWQLKKTATLTEAFTLVVEYRP